MFPVGVTWGFRSEAELASANGAEGSSKTRSDLLALL